MAKTTPTTITHHSRPPEGTARGVQLHWYASAEEIERINAMAQRVAELPISRSLLVRVALDVLDGLLNAGIKPNIHRYALMKRTIKAEDGPRAAGLLIDFATLAADLARLADHDAATPAA